MIRFPFLQTLAVLAMAAGALGGAAGCGLAQATTPSAAAAQPRPEGFGQRPRIDGQRMLADLAVLAHDSLEGRQTGTAGSERARRFLTQAFDSRGIAALPSGRTRPFQFS